MRTSGFQRVAFSSLAIASVIMIAGDETPEPPCPPPPCYQEYYNCTNQGGTCQTVSTNGPLYRQAPVGQPGMSALNSDPLADLNQISYTGGGPGDRGAFACSGSPPAGWMWVDGKCPATYGNPQMCCAYDPTKVQRVPSFITKTNSLGGVPCTGAAPTPPPCEWEN